MSEAEQLERARAIVRETLRDNGNDPERALAALYRRIDEDIEIARVFALVGSLVIDSALARKH